jgi:hypothetical protein
MLFRLYLYREIISEAVYPPGVAQAEKYHKYTTKDHPSRKEVSYVSALGSARQSGHCNEERSRFNEEEYRAQEDLKMPTKTT